MPEFAAGSNPWSVAQHDTIPQADLWLNPLETHVYLSAFLAAEGEEFSPPYSGIRERIQGIVADIETRQRQGQRPRDSVTDSRLRTWKSMFENFGFLYVDEIDGQVHLSRLGAVVRDLYEQLNQRIEGANDHLAQVGVEILNRYTLRNPIDSGSYPTDADTRPFRFIWKAMRRLDDKLHWEELNRVIMKVNYSRDEDPAIEHIRTIREQVRGIYSEGNANLLGEPAVQEGPETKRRITPWFTRAGFGSLLITGTDDDQGYRYLVERHKPLIDNALDQEITIPSEALTSRSAYLRYLTNVPTIIGELPSTDDQAEIQRVINAVSRFGKTKIICITGIPGTGKSRLAKLAATALVDGDLYRLEEIQFHESTTYDDFMEGFVPKPTGTGFELVPKVFRVINRRALLDPSGRTYVLLIEEFSRANVHSVLGELITYIEHRDRPFRLMTSQSEMSVASNLVVLATMNPRDKSALSLDHAILRRMHLLECPSSVERLRSMLEGRLPPDLLAQLSTWFAKHIGFLPFGHGVFAEVVSSDDLNTVWNGTIRYFLTDLSGNIKPQFDEVVRDYPWK